MGSPGYDEWVERSLLVEAVAEPSQRFLSMLLALEDEDFAVPVHRDVFREIAAQVTAGTFCGLSGMARPLLRASKRDPLQAAELFAEIEAGHFMPPRTAGQIEGMCRTLRMYRRQREAGTRARIASDEIERLPVGEVPGGLAEIADDFSAMSADLADVAPMLHGRDAAVAQVEEITTPTARASRRVFTGIRDLDDTLGGLDPGLLTLLGARPSVGKTAFSKGVVLQALRDGLAVLAIVAEGSRRTFMRGLLAQMTGISFGRLMRGSVSASEAEALRAAAAHFDGWRLELNDGKGITPAQVVARTARLKQTTGLDLVVVDYLQCLAMPKADSREQQVAKTSRAFADMAGEHQVAALVLCQLNRELGAREDKIPRLTDLRESGSLEQDADVVLFLHRNAALDQKADPRPATCRIAKNRFGPTGDVRLDFDPQITRFSGERP